MAQLFSVPWGQWGLQAGAAGAPGAALTHTGLPSATRSLALGPSGHCSSCCSPEVVVVSFSFSSFFEEKLDGPVLGLWPRHWLLGGAWGHEVSRAGTETHITGLGRTRCGRSWPG